MWLKVICFIYKENWMIIIVIKIIKDEFGICWWIKSLRNISKEIFKGFFLKFFGYKMFIDVCKNIYVKGRLNWIFMGEYYVKS